MAYKSRKRIAIAECARIWRQEQARATLAGEGAQAAHAEQCAQNFEARLVRTCRVRKQLDATPALPSWRGQTGAA